MSAHKDRIYQAVSDSPGTGAATLGTAFDGFRTMSAAYGTNATVPGVLFTEGNTWEVCQDCAYDHSAGTIGRGTLVASSSGSRISFGNSTVVASVPISSWATNLDNRVLGHSAHDGTADVTGVIGTLHVFAALTADRTFTLPSSANAGDRVGVSFPAGSASYEVLIKSASGDKINNVDCSSTEWSRLFVAGEVVVFRCIDSSTVDWLVEQDGRIPSIGRIYLATDNANTTTGGTVPLDTNDSAMAQGDIVHTAGNGIKVRRTGKYHIETNYSGGNYDVNKYLTTNVVKNGSTLRGVTLHRGPVAGPTYSSASITAPLAVDDVITQQFGTDQTTTKSHYGGNDYATCDLVVSEVL